MGWVFKLASLVIKLYSSRKTFLGRLSAVFLISKIIRSWKCVQQNTNGRTERSHRDEKFEHRIFRKALETRAASELMVRSQSTNSLRSSRRCSCCRELRILRKMKCNICKLADLESTAQTPGSSQDANSERVK